MRPNPTMSASRGKGKGARIFNNLAVRYDQWFDSPRGRAIFEMEIACLRELMRAGGVRHWVEIGVGTGRFAEALGVRDGIDPSGAVLELAKGRGVRPCLGYGEELPYPDSVFDGVLMVTTICFLAEPVKALRECFRVLKKHGCFVVGFVPADSRWGKLYTRKGREGHPFYAAAKFYSVKDVVQLTGEAGFMLDCARSCLFTQPDEPVAASLSREGLVKGAGFVALRLSKRVRG